MIATTKQINLIPAETRFLIQWTLSRAIVPMTLALITGLVAVHLMQERTINNYAGRIMESERDLEALTGQQMAILEIIGSIEKISDRKSELEVIREIVTDHRNTSIIWSSVIADMVENAGKEMWFEKLEVYDDRRKLKDKTVSKVKMFEIEGRSFSQGSIADFVGFIEDYKLLQKVVLAGSVQEVYGERTVYRFLVIGEVGS
ncbi:MAG: hypothetical protein KOO63_16310 [Bacteroidales bacterium]|nr:hypothetical protein [Candidatus Latescibacterota bacterium]